MLQKLSIRNYALIDSLDIEFDAGLNIITGETGAGKSIILGALALILGQRSESKYFFNQDKKCIIEGIFQLRDEKLRILFEANDLDFATETSLRREISIDGKTRSFINDTPVTLAILKAVGEKLIDIHSQQATLELNNKEFQLQIVDTLANHFKLLSDYKSGFKLLRKLKQEHLKLEAEATEARSRQDYEQFLFTELTEANLIDGEQEELEQELERFTNAEQIKKALLIASSILVSDDTCTSNMLKEATNQLNGIEKFDQRYAELNERLKSALIELKDVAGELEQYENQVLHSAERLTLIQERLDKLYSLQQKHRVGNVAELIAKRESLAESLDQISNTDESILRLAKEIALLSEKLSTQAKQLADGRKKGIKIAEESIGKLLTAVNLPQAKIKFVQQQLEQLNANGLDEIELLFTANAGQGPAPVHKVASGGELSRLMLAIKAVLAKQDSLPTQIFDEIDTGISGETALKVGEVITNLGNDMQVIAITHLPQIASKGQSHFWVYKSEDTDKTTTGLRRLDKEERVLALAEMLSGKNPGESAIQNAKDLLG